MGELVYLEEYKDKLLRKEIDELREEIQRVMSSWPDPSSGYFLSLEEMDRIEKLWLEEKEKL